MRWSPPAPPGRSRGVHLGADRAGGRPPPFPDRPAACGSWPASERRSSRRPALSTTATPSRAGGSARRRVSARRRQTARERSARSARGAPAPPPPPRASLALLDAVAIDDRLHRLIGRLLVLGVGPIGEQAFVQLVGARQPALDGVHPDQQQLLFILEPLPPPDREALDLRREGRPDPLVQLLGGQVAPDDGSPQRPRIGPRLQGPFVFVALGRRRSVGLREGDGSVVVAARRLVEAPVGGQPALELRVGGLAPGNRQGLARPDAVGQELANRGVVSIEVVAQGLPIQRLLPFPAAQLAVQ